MQMTDEVRRALQTLRDNATNDFERHRIDVLERDLTNPPRVEVVDDKHQRFNGLTYCQNNDLHYTAHTSIHRAVWSYCNGDIPNGFVVHHIDENKSNNDVENLQCLTAIEHNAIHYPKKTIAQRVDRSRICEVCGKSFEYKHKCQKTCSPECGKILSGRTIKGRKIVERVISKCELCGKEIVHLPCEHPRFCSQNCLLKYMNQRRHKK